MHSLLMLFRLSSYDFAAFCQSCKRELGLGYQPQQPPPQQPPQQVEQLSKGPHGVGAKHRPVNRIGESR